MTNLNAAGSNVWGWFAVLRQKKFDMSSQNLKLLKETKEFVEEPSLDEAADVFISLIGSVYSQGWTTEELAKAVHHKMTINRGRTWEQLEDGTYQHVASA